MHQDPAKAETGYLVFEEFGDLVDRPTVGEVSICQQEQVVEALEDLRGGLVNGADYGASLCNKALQDLHHILCSGAVQAWIWGQRLE